MKILQLHPGDENRLKQIRLRSLLEDPDAFGSTYKETKSRPPESWTSQLEKLVTFVVVVNEQDVGIVRGVADESDATRSWLISLWVAPEARRRGAGEHLVQAILNWAKSADFTCVCLEVGNHNLTAQALYTRLGFEMTGAKRTLASPREHITELEMICRI